MEATLGLVGFWFLEVNSLLFVYMLFNFFLSGHMFPLDMVDEPYKSLLFWSPLQYLAYFPAGACVFGQIRRPDLGESCCWSKRHGWCFLWFWPAGCIIAG